MDSRQYTDFGSHNYNHETSVTDKQSGSQIAGPVIISLPRNSPAQLKSHLFAKASQC